MRPFTPVRVDPETYEVVKQIAASEDRSMGTIVRRALRSYLTHEAEPRIRNLAAVVSGPELPRGTREANGKREARAEVQHG